MPRSKNPNSYPEAIKLLCARIAQQRPTAWELQCNSVQEAYTIRNMYYGYLRAVERDAAKDQTDARHTMVVLCRGYVVAAIDIAGRSLHKESKPPFFLRWTLRDLTAPAQTIFNQLDKIGQASPGMSINPAGNSELPPRFTDVNLDDDYDPEAERKQDLQGFYDLAKKMAAMNKQTPPDGDKNA